MQCKIGSVKNNDLFSFVGGVLLVLGWQICLADESFRLQAFGMIGYFEKFQETPRGHENVCVNLSKPYVYLVHKAQYKNVYSEFSGRTVVNM